MKIQLPFGQQALTVQIPDDFHTEIIQNDEIAPADDPTASVGEALDNLLGSIGWDYFIGASSVAIAINDKTRPVPNGTLLPPLLEKLSDIGISRDAVTFFIAVGTHSPMVPDEFHLILPDEIVKNFRVISHDAEDQDTLTYLDDTTRGTPIWVNREYVESEVKIVVGTIEPHQFAGFSGGVKSAAIGLGGVETINRNHALMTSPDAIIGEYENNPVRQDIEEIGQQIGVDLAVNVILNHDREIVRTLVGEPKALMQAGVSISRECSSVPVNQKFELVITSPGGHPKDINVYQSQKGLAHATMITKPGGMILLVAACPEGSGSELYEEWVSGKQSHQEVIGKFMGEGFRIGPHKAYQISRDAANFHLMTFTAMEDPLANRLLLNPVPNLQEAVNHAAEKIGPSGRVGIMPFANTTIPYVEKRTP